MCIYLNKIRLERWNNYNNTEKMQKIKFGNNIVYIEDTIQKDLNMFLILL